MYFVASSEKIPIRSVLLSRNFQFVYNQAFFHSCITNIGVDTVLLLAPSKTKARHTDFPFCFPFRVTGYF